VIVSCVSKKIWDIEPDAPQRWPAGTAYAGAYFTKNRLYAMSFGEAWCILSAKFGLMLPEDEIENYNVTFKHRRNTELVTLSELSKQVKEKGLSRYRTIQVLGGREYVDKVVAAFAGSGVQIQAPLAGLRIGETMHAVQAATDSGVPLDA
jgi:hypothetical protein